MSSNIENKQILNRIKTLEKKFWRLSDTIWGLAELGLEEHRSADLLADTLGEAGFEVQRGVGRMPTAFVATWQQGTGQPVIGLTAEYDALPALSQKAVPHREAVIPGAPGHGCGHNTMAAMQALAAVAVKDIMAADGRDCTLKFFGCPAEELGVSRPFMVRDGLFDNVDVIIDCHADFQFKTTHGMLGTALHSAQFSFEGQSAHAAWKPWMGRSAGDAVELMHAGTERMREHVPPTNRIHWVTTFAGEAPNVVPDRAVTWYFIRDLDENLADVVQWVNDCARAAALMTQTRHRVKVLAAVHQRFYNACLARRLYANMKIVGKPRYTSREKEFALTLQQEAGFPARGMRYPLSLVDAAKDELRASSSDIGDVCLVIPTGQISIPVWVPGTPAHSWTATASGATSIAHKGISAGAKVVALTIRDLLDDPGLIAAARDEFEVLRRQRPYTSFLPPEAEPPLGFYQDLMARYRPLMESHGKPD